MHANTQAEEIRKQATEIKRQADVELAKSKSASVKSQEQLRWLESRIETIKHYEESSHSLMDFFKTQLDNVKKTLAKVSGVILSSTTFTLIDNNVIHKTYSVNNTNPYPVTADSDEYNFSLALEANEELSFLTDDVGKRLAVAFTTGEVTISPAELEPEIRRNIVKMHPPLDL